MKKNIINKLLLLAAIGFAAVGCESNYYNEEYLDGFNPDTEITDVQTIEYTLTEDDYSTISKNSTNKTNAEAAGQEAVDALTAIGKNKYFGSDDEAAAYIPAFLATAYPTVDNSSVAVIGYKTALAVPEKVQQMNAATAYTLTNDDYQTIWDGAEDYANAVTPVTESKIATVIPSEGLSEGDYVAVTYNYLAEANQDNSDDSGNGEEPVTPSDYTSVLGSAVLNDVVEVKGYISAVSTQGPILTDKGGSILLYKTTGYEVGDEVTVSGTITAFNCGFQIQGGTVTKTGTTTVTYPVPMELTGEMMDELLTTRTADEYAYFVKIQGTVAVSGTYYNFNVPGATTAVGSFYGLTDDQKALLSDGQECTIYGYFFSISKSSGAPKYINFVTVSVDEAPAIEAGNSYTSVLGSAVLNDAVEVKGYISAVSAQGPILTDNGGSVLLYKTTGYEIGDEVSVSGTISSYNKGFQIGTSGLTIEKTGTTTVTYPTPLELTGAKMDELLTTRTADDYAIYAKMTGTASVGSYINFIVDGATTAQGSVYGATDALKEQLTDGLACTLYGYFCSISSGKYINMIVTQVEVTSAVSAVNAAAPEKLYAYYRWNGTSFETTDIIPVQPSDYADMGQTYGSFTDPDQDKYLPRFLNTAGVYSDVAYVAYRCYSGGSTSWKVDEYTYADNAWSKTIYFTDKQGQFRKNEGAWAADRTLELDYTEMGTTEFKAFCQYCCNWVYDNVDVALGAPARDNAGVIINANSVTVGGASPAGSYFVSNYGNNEWYAGTYAYYGEMNWSASKARASFEAAGYTGLSDDELVALMQSNAAEVFGAVLGYMYPDMTEKDFNQVVVKVYDYVSKSSYAYTFNVVEKGTFAYAEGSMTEL